MSQIPFDPAAKLSRQFRNYVYQPQSADQPTSNEQWRQDMLNLNYQTNPVPASYVNSFLSGYDQNNLPFYGQPDFPQGMNQQTPYGLYNNRITGGNGMATGINPDIYGPNISQPMQDGGKTTQGPANISAQQLADTKARLEKAKAIQASRGWTPQVQQEIDILQQQLAYADQRSVLGSQYGGAGTASSNLGNRTKMTPAQIGRTIADYESGKSSPKNIDSVYSDYFDMPQSLQDVAQKAYSPNTGTAKTPPNLTGNSQPKPQSNSQGTALQKATQYASPISYPSFSGNPASSFAAPNYINNSGQYGGALGPQGEVTISQGKPADLGWSTGSSYDPNTGLSKWSSQGLTNGENYYDNFYAELNASERARAANAQAEGAAASQRRAAGFARQDVINQVVDQMVAGGRDKSLARVDAKNMSDAQLSQYVSQAASAAANVPNPQLQSLLDQFANPNYAQTQPLNQPLVNGQQQPAASISREEYDARMKQLIEGNLPVAERTRQISETQQLYANGRAAANPQLANPVSDTNQQYQAVVQSQQAQQQQQQLSQQYQEQLNAANAANQARYDDMIAGYQNNQQNVSDYLTNQGRQQTEDINRNSDRFNARNTQDLITRGLGNTTVLNSTQRGIEEDRQRALQNSQEQIDGQRLQYQTAAQQALLGAMERRTDQGLSQGLGNSAGAGAGYGTGPTAGTSGSYSGTGGSNPANSAYNPIYNTQGSMSQPANQQQQVPAPTPQLSAASQHMMNYTQEAGPAQSNFDSTQYVNGAGGSISSPTVNPWTDPQQANKAGQTSDQQFGVNARSNDINPQMPGQTQPLNQPMVNQQAATAASSAAAVAAAARARAGQVAPAIPATGSIQQRKALQQQQIADAVKLQQHLADAVKIDNGAALYRQQHISFPRTEAVPMNSMPAGAVKIGNGAYRFPGT